MYYLLAVFSDSCPGLNEVKSLVVVVGCGGGSGGGEGIGKLGPWKQKQIMGPHQNLFEGRRF